MTSMRSNTHRTFSDATTEPRWETNNGRELRDEELQNVRGGCTSTYSSVSLGLRKSAGNQATGVMF